MRETSTGQFHTGARADAVGSAQHNSAPERVSAGKATVQVSEGGTVLVDEALRPK